MINNETEDKLKMLIFNLCREIKQIFVIFTASPHFTNNDTSSPSENENKDLGASSPWLVLNQLEKDFAVIRDDEMASYDSSIAGVIVEENKMIFPRDAKTGLYTNFRLTIRYSSKTSSPCSSGNEQFSES